MTFRRRISSRSERGPQAVGPGRWGRMLLRDKDSFSFVRPATSSLAKRLFAGFLFSDLRPRLGHEQPTLRLIRLADQEGGADQTGDKHEAALATTAWRPSACACSAPRCSATTSRSFSTASLTCSERCETAIGRTLRLTADALAAWIGSVLSSPRRASGSRAEDLLWSKPRTPLVPDWPRPCRKHARHAKRRADAAGRPS